MLENPFLTFGYESAEYFCDRETETKELIKLLTNGNNVTLISPRRMGKTGLIYHVFAQPELSKYYTFIVDVYATKNLQEFTYELSKGILSQLMSGPRKTLDTFINIATSIKSGISFDFAGNPSWNLQIGDIQKPIVTLDEIFYYLEKADKPCIVAIDEFQVVATYEETNVEATLRTYIQRCRQTNFIFSGSQRSMMREIFTSPARPFYQSTSTIPLYPIAVDKYCDFAKNLFAIYHKTIQPSTVKTIYEQFNGTTWYIQKILNVLFTNTAVGETCQENEIAETVHHIIQSNEGLYADWLFILPVKQKELLFAIAQEGRAQQITGSKFIKKYRLSSASSIQKAATALQEKQIITQEQGTYQVYDLFFALWLQKQVQIG